GDVTIERRATRVSDGALVLRDDGAAAIGAPDADGYFQPAQPVPMFMCPSPVGISVIDTPIRLELTIRRADDSSAVQAGVEVIPVCPDDARDFCERICTG